MSAFGVSQPVRRVEDPRLLKGAGCYADDIRAAGQLHGVVLRSPHASARIGRLGLARARGVAGVAAIYTSADLNADGIGGLPCLVPMTNRDGAPGAAPPHPVLADGAVRHVGDPVAFIVAGTLAAARDAAELVDVEYEPLTSVTDPAAALCPGAPLVWPDVPGNQAFDWEVGDRARTEALFAEAARVTEIRLVNNRIVVASMEARVALAEYDASAGRWTLTTNTQGGWLIKDAISAAVFHEAADRFRVVTPDVGGGFGMKLFLYAEHVLTCYAARKLGRPVKWASDRSEAFLCDTHGRDNVTTGEIATDKEGRFLALRTRNVANMGAYLSNYGPFIPTFAATSVLPGVYGFQSVYANVVGVFTNTVPVDAYRGAGRPESNYLLERLIDETARALGIDPVELRRRNMVLPSQMPHQTPVGKTYDSGDFVRVLEAGLDRFGWSGFDQRREAAASRGKLLGRGLAYYLESTGGAPSERAEIRFADDGFVDLYVGTQSTGQGHETAYVQLTADRLGVDGARIRVRQGDTDTIPIGGGTGGARSLYSEGQAILATAATVIEKGKRAAADMLETAPADIAFEAGLFSIVGTDRSVDIITLAAEQHRAIREGREGTILDAAEVVPVDTHTFPNGCHLAEVEVDPETGRTRVVRYVVCDDVGRAINPLIVRGQVHGGVAQGIGQAVLERTVFDPESGQLLSASFMDYALPRADDLPAIDVDLIEVPCETNPLGVKGAGEAGAVGSPPAVMNAILDALAARGVRQLDMPATPARVWEALQSARAAA